MKDLKNPEYYYNREWSWLDFNQRVLFEAGEKRNPLLERLKFISIVSSNLEEFFMVRVAILKKQQELGVPGSTMDKLSPTEQLNGIRQRALDLLSQQYSIFYDDIVPALKKQNINILTQEKELKPHYHYLSAVFESQLVQVLTPISVGPTHPFPKLVTGRIYLAVELIPEEDRPKAIEKSSLSFVTVPTNTFGRFIKVGDRDDFVPLEIVVKMFVDRIYSGYQIQSVGVVRATRDADFSINIDAVSDLLTEIESKIKRRHQHYSVIKLTYEKGLSDNVLNIIIKENNLESDYIYEIDGMLNLKDVFDIYTGCDRDDLKDHPQVPVYPTVFKDKNIFEVMASRDVVIFHPYHSYDSVIELLHKAAEDENVLAIKQTLYRTSSKSAIIEGLVKAAENGKYVSVVEELQARFDEKRNIEMAKRLEEAGAHVIYGIAGLKTHAKALLIIRREKHEIKRYIHLSTGNYNETTAKLYSDFSLFTCDEHIGQDIGNLFNLLTGFSMPTAWNAVAVAPLNMRDKFYSLIRREAENASNGMKGRIIAKMNSLLDGGIIEELYKASIAGVKIDLVIRGICALKPGIKGVSDNIRVFSIVGKFLEHPRVYNFYNGGDPEYYLSSADWMTRNLDRRVELVFPVRSKSEKNFLKKILDLQFEDTVNIWELKNGAYHFLESASETDSFEEIYSFIRQREEKKKKSITDFKPLQSPEKDT